MANDPFMEIAVEGIETIKKSVRSWAAEERAHNPSFGLVVGSKSFTIDQIEEHILKGTDDGKMLYRMIFQAGADLFLKR